MPGAGAVPVPPGALGSRMGPGCLAWGRVPTATTPQPSLRHGILIACLSFTSAVLAKQL